MLFDKESFVIYTFTFRSLYINGLKVIENMELTET